MVLALVPLAAGGSRAASGTDVNGAWQGSITAEAATGSAVASLTQRGAHVTGTLTADAGAVHGTFTVSGRTRGATLRLRGRLGRTRLVWRAHPDAAASTWSGTLAVRARRARLRGVLALTRDAAGGVRCGDDWFASDVMPRVLVPICAQCHVDGGLAATAPFRVTVGDVAATALSALREVNAGNPSQSKLLLKPRAALPHGGGQRVAPGSAEDDVLGRWVALVTAPGCDVSGGGGGGPRTGARLWTDECASCHGADARGLDGRPDVRCNRAIADAVRNGRSGGTLAMPAFPALSDADVAAIQDHLRSLCPVPGATGDDLFAGNCATCHGADALGVAGRGPAVRCSKHVHDAVRYGAPPMPALPALSDDEIALIQTALDDRCPPGTAGGAELWAANCAHCHGADAGGQGDAPNVRCATRVGDALWRGRGAAMPAFPELLGADLTALAASLDGLCTTWGRTGAALYAGNCSTCHGPTAHGGRNALGVAGPSIACTGSGDYHEKVANGDGRMPAFPALDWADVDLIVGFAHGQLCTGG